MLVFSCSVTSFDLPLPDAILHREPNGDEGQEEVPRPPNARVRCALSLLACLLVSGDEQTSPPCLAEEVQCIAVRWPLPRIHGMSQGFCLLWRVAFDFAWQSVGTRHAALRFRLSVRVQFTSSGCGPSLVAC